MKSRLFFLFNILFLIITVKTYGQNLTHEITDEEKAMMPAYLARLKGRALDLAPTGNVRPIAEFEPSQGVLVAYPFGIPVSLIAEMSEDVIVTTIVDNLSQENTVKSTYQSNGVNLDNCNFLYAPHDSYWTRDYGPWFIANEEKIEIIDFIYNRPRQNDNLIPQSLGEMLDAKVYNMDLVQTGGNYMTDGINIAAATDLVWDENTSLSHNEIDQLMNSYLGIDNYYVTEDPQGEYIKHIDCWGKFLDVDKVLIAEVPSSNPNYSKYESTAEYFANLTTPYGNKYQVFRVNEPSGQPYTNSLILNNKVLVPITGSSYDEAALQVYRDAMPGYEVIGFTGSWESTDALHCRVHEIIDLGMLSIRHIPLLGEINYQNGFTITADITSYSNQTVYGDSLKVLYKVNSGNYQSVLMSKTTGNSYQAVIPAQTAGSVISYYIHAADYSGRSENHPYIGKHDPHVFIIKSTTVNPPVADFSSNVTLITAGKSVAFTDESTNYPTNWSWSFPGGSPSTSTAQNPSVTYSTNGTYEVSLTVSNSAGTDTETKTGYITVEEAPISYCSSGGADFSDEWISEVQIGNFSNSSSGASYTDFTNMNIELTSGESTNIELTPEFNSSSYTEYWVIWIDYNNDGDFEDSGEAVYSGSGKSAVSGSFTVSDISTTTRMRISMKYNGAPTPCETFSYGEVEDYTVTISEGTVSIPVADFSAAPTTITEGQAVQFTDISTNEPTSWSWSFPGGSPSTSTAQNPSVTYSTNGTYEVSLTVSNSAGTDTESKTGYITVEKASIEYCSTGGSDFSYEWISEVQIGSFSNSSSGASYTDFTNMNIELTSGESTNIVLTPGFGSGSYTEYWVIWIDYNNDGDFEDSGEAVYSGSGKSAVSGSFTVSDISTTTRMRISMKYNGTPSPCETYSYGEVEDYTVSLTRSEPGNNRSITNINDELSETKFKVYPNPVKDNLHITIDLLNAEIKIINSVGAVVESRAANSDENVIDVSDLIPGLYTIHINSNGKVLIDNFIKQ